MPTRRRGVQSNTLTLTGIDAIDRRLLELSTKSIRKVVRSAVSGAQTLGVRIVRQEIDADDSLSPQLKRALKRTLGSRFKRKRTGDLGMESKFGFSVGKRNTAKRSGKNKSGVGIDKANAHWFALGTRIRTVKTGRFAGRRVGKVTMVKVMSRAAKKIGRAVFTRMVQISRDKLKDEINTLARMQ